MGKRGNKRDPNWIEPDQDEQIPRKQRRVASESAAMTLLSMRMRQSLSSLSQSAMPIESQFGAPTSAASSALAQPVASMVDYDPSSVTDDEEDGSKGSHRKSGNRSSLLKKALVGRPPVERALPPSRFVLPNVRQVPIAVASRKSSIPLGRPLPPAPTLPPSILSSRLKPLSSKL